MSTTVQTRWQTPIMRCSFPKVVDTDKFGKYSAVGIVDVAALDPIDKKFWDAMIAQAHAVKDAKWPDKKGGWVGCKSPFRKGIQDDGSNGGYDLVKYPEYKEIPADKLKDEFYPGCWFIAFVTFFTSENEGTKRVSIGAQSFMKVKDDTPLGGVRQSAAEQFAEVDLSRYGVDNSKSFAGGGDAGI